MTRSPLHDLHTRIGARFTDFGGWEMPVQYASVIAEHHSVREAAGVFDVSHLGRFELSGQGAVEALRHLLSNDITRIGPGRCQYSLMLNERGGIEDDLLVWWWEEDRFWIMPNAANHDEVMGTFVSAADTVVTDLRAQTVMLAVQGPAAPQLLEKVIGSAPQRYRNMSTSIGGARVDIAGTGYSGERGGELCTDPSTAEELFERLIIDGATPCGLGARDTLRLEAGLALWGDDIGPDTTPFEAGLDSAVALDERDFVGREAIATSEVGRRLTGFVMDERGIPRRSNALRTRGGSTGETTSGNISPMLGKGIGLGYLSPPAGTGEPIEVRIRDRWVAGRVVEPPFHKG